MRRTRPSNSPGSSAHFWATLSYVNRWESRADESSTGHDFGASLDSFIALNEQVSRGRAAAEVGSTDGASAHSSAAFAFAARSSLPSVGCAPCLDPVLRLL